MTNSKVFGYVRVSSQEQEVARQVDKMLGLGINERDIYIEKASGKDFERPIYQALKHQLRQGDLLYLDALDRLGRNYELILKEWKEITRVIGADIIVLDNDSLFNSKRFRAMNSEGSKLGDMLEDQMLSLLAYVADDERRKLLKRQREGIDAAKKAGKAFGRPQINLSTLSKAQRATLEELYPAWKSPDEIMTGVYFAKQLGLKKSTFYKVIKQYENEIGVTTKEA